MEKGDKVIVVHEFLSAFGQEGVVTGIDRNTGLVKARMNEDGYTMEYNPKSLKVI